LSQSLGPGVRQVPVKLCALHSKTTTPKGPGPDALGAKFISGNVPLAIYFGKRGIDDSLLVWIGVCRKIRGRE
jgi:hypothetical protein